MIVRGESRAWTLRYTAPVGRQRENGRGALADEGLKAALAAAAETRDKVRRDIDPLGAAGRWNPERRTPEGKAKVSRNADKGDTREILWELSRALREQEQA